MMLSDLHKNTPWPTTMIFNFRSGAGILRQLTDLQGFGSDGSRLDLSQLFDKLTNMLSVVDVLSCLSPCYHSSLLGFI